MCTDTSIASENWGGGGMITLEGIESTCQFCQNWGSSIGVAWVKILGRGRGLNS